MAASKSSTLVVSKLVKLVKGTGAAVLVGAAAGLALKAIMPITRWRFRKLPGTRYKPFVGDAAELSAQGVTSFLDNKSGAFKSSPVFKMWAGPRVVVVVRDTRLGIEMLKTLSTRAEANVVPWARKYEREPWGNILLFINGDKWMKGRRATEESVAHAAALHSHIPGIQANIDKLLRSLDHLSQSKGLVDVQACCISMAEDVISQAIFGVDMHCAGSDSKSSSVLRVLESVAAVLPGGAGAPGKTLLAPEQIEDGWWDKYSLSSPEFGKRFLSSALSFSNTLFMKPTVYSHLCTGFPGLLPVWRLMARVLPDKNATLHRKMIRGVQQGCLKLIDNWSAEHLVAQPQGQQVSASPPARTLGIMPQILSKAASEGEQVDENELLGVIIGALFGGFDTTGNLLAMSLYYLSRNPEVQRKAQVEVDSVLGGKVPDSKDLNDLPYLQGFVSEVLRLAPPASFTTRMLVDDYEGPGGAFKIPKGTSVWFPLYTYHRDSSIWPRPTEFLPERHIQPGHEDLAPASLEMLVPFGAGARRCPGYRFALLEVRLTLARILQQVEFHAPAGCPEPVMRTNVVHIPDQVMLKVVKRAQAAPAS